MKIIKGQSNKTKQNLFDTLVPVAILALTLSFIIYCIVINTIDNNKNNQKQYNANVDKVIEKVNNEKIVIAFNDVTTTRQEYDILHNNCIEFAKQNNINIENIETNVKVTENTYIDSADNKYNKNKSDTMYETGPIYLQDALLIRFISEQGEMKVIASKASKSIGLENYFTNDNISSAVEDITYETVDNTELADIFYTDAEELKKYTGIGNIKEMKKLYNDGSTNITENNYFNDISNIFIEMIKQSSDNIDKELKDKALLYFTEDGYNNIVSSVEHINSDADVRVSFIRAGKSDIRQKYCDRVIMQIVTSNSNKEIYTNIIIKLDSSYKVFDIDII